MILSVKIFLQKKVMPSSKIIRLSLKNSPSGNEEIKIYYNNYERGFSFVNNGQSQEDGDCLSMIPKERKN